MNVLRTTTSLITVVSSAILSTVVAHGFARVDTTLLMSDGTALSVAIFLPDGAPPENGWPAILSAHGFGGSRNGNVSRTSRYADSGYVAVTWSMRGQGRGGAPAHASEGKYDWFTGDREIEDVREILEWMGSRPDVRADRIAIEGISQGGLTSWGAAIKRLPVRCAVPVASVPHYGNVHIHNGGLNFFTQTVVNLARSTGLVEMGPFMGDSVWSSFQNDQYDRLVRLFESKELIDSVGRIQVPMFVQLAWQDDLFSTASLFRALRSMSAPHKVVLYPGGHGGQSAEIFEYLTDLTLRFYRHWLKDDMSGTIMATDSLIAFTDNADTTYNYFSPDDLDKWTPRESGGGPARTLYFAPSDQLIDTAPGFNYNYTKLYIQNVTNAATVFRSQPFEQDVTMTGAELSCLAESTANTWQVNVLLWDHDPETDASRPITRGAWQVRGSGDAQRIEYQLSPQLYTLKEGHVLEARVKFGMPLTKPTDEFGRAVTAPRATANTTFRSPYDRPAYIRLYLRDDESSVPLSRADSDEHVRISGLSVARSGVLTLDMNAPESRRGTARQIEVYSLRGSKVASLSTVGTTAVFDLGDLRAGMYVVAVVSDGAIVDSRIFHTP